MPIFTRNNIHVLYIHVPKTGGSHIEHFFKQNGFAMSEHSAGQREIFRLRNCSPQHMHAEQIKELYKIKKFNYVFMTVRNPVFRLRSEYIMRHRDFNKDSSLSKKDYDINAWWKMTKRKFKSNAFIFDNHIRPQCEFHIRGIDIFKQEDGYGENWVKELENKIGVEFDFSNIPRKRSVENLYGRDIKKIILNDDTFEDIKNFYQADYLKFDYSPLTRW